MVRMGISVNSEILGEGCRIGMVVILVRVRVKDSDKSVIIYVFLDNGSNFSFCIELFMK